MVAHYVDIIIVIPIVNARAIWFTTILFGILWHSGGRRALRAEYANFPGR